MYTDNILYIIACHQQGNNHYRLQEKISAIWLAERNTILAIFVTLFSTFLFLTE